MNTETPDEAENRLRKELRNLVKPKNGDVYINEFGTAFMLVPNKKVICLLRDGVSSTIQTTKKWDDIINDDKLTKLGNVSQILFTVHHYHQH